MQVEARFRRRSAAEENVADLNDAFLEQFSSISGVWNRSKSIGDVPFDAGTGESSAANLTPCLREGIKGAISYASRIPAAIIDRATSDDVLVLQFEINDDRDFEFCIRVFPRIVTAFSPYRAALVTDLDQDLDDFEDIAAEAQRTGADIDGRDSVFRIHPLNYFDDILCRRAFHSSPMEMKERLEPRVERVEMIGDGICFLVSSAIPGNAELLALDATIRSYLD